MNSLEHRTDLIFWRASGEVLMREGYTVISTPCRRGWYWGNLLIFDRPPRAGDLAQWSQLFRLELDDPAIRHMLFVWDRPEGTREELDEFLAAGFELEESLALAATSVHAPPHPNFEVEIRRVVTDEEWEAVIADDISDRPERFEPLGYARFVRARVADYRRLVDDGRGAWYGAFIDGRLVANLGIFRDGALARFQNVSTTPSRRRQGICGTLVASVSRHVLDSGVEQLVMVADENYDAARIYESVGFRPVSRSAGLLLYPPQERR